MAELKLLYDERGPSRYGNAWIVLEGGYSSNADGTILLTPDCGGIEGLNQHIDGFVHDLERIRNQATAAFEAAQSKPPRDPFSESN
jgi:hypothetical protein